LNVFLPDQGHISFIVDYAETILRTVAEDDLGP